MKLYFKITFAALLALAGCTQAPEKDKNAPDAQKFVIRGEAQGTYYAVTYYAADSVITKERIDSVMRIVDRCVSVYDTTSLISLINKNDPAARPDGLFRSVFLLSQRVSEITGGAFDITVGPLVSAWGFGFKKGIKPDSLTVDSLKSLVGYKKVSLSEGKISKEKPGMKLDFNAIAQGYTVDLLSVFLLSQNINRFLVDVGGEVSSRGTKDGGENWVVGVEQPAKDMNSGQEVRTTLELINESVSTSGNYRKYYEENGIRYSHTIDPATGYPVKHSLLSVSVKTKSCAVADAFATAFMVMGLEKSQKFLRSHKGLEAYFIYADPDGSIKDISTEGFFR